MATTFLKVSTLNSNIGNIKIYVGEDGKLHFVNKDGADSVLPFNSRPEYFKVAIQADSGSVNTNGKVHGIIAFPSKFIKAIQLYDLGEQNKDGNVDITICTFDGILTYNDIPSNKKTTIVSKTIDRSTVPHNPVYIDIPIISQTRENIFIDIRGCNWNYAQTAYFKAYYA